MGLAATLADAATSGLAGAVTGGIGSIISGGLGLLGGLLKKNNNALSRVPDFYLRAVHVRRCVSIELRSIEIYSILYVQIHRSGRRRNTLVTSI